ncbi:hypothetical protein FB192DRAFT_1350715 [Mucor lusitanicus]|uniref:Uncharacterized protein n=1 Tax=Mucor circinelloides f. lusitanicus TaxID=29924 RepID=A0A8H4BRZ4_MUCCL|nr:hypothetical protein FB192DRAFT_1350715 [Mucor lusitanicus]
MSKALVSLMVNLLRICSLQATGHQAVYGLSLCVSTLVNLIVTGECSTGSHPGHLDFSQIDLNGRGIIGQDAQQTISVLAPITQDVLQLFSSNGFYKIACAVVGQKNLDRHTAEYSILERLSSQLREDDHAQFVCGPWVNDACKRFFTNFSNMWSPNSCFGDLRVVMELLLRIHLCSQRFFNPKTHHKDKKKNKDKKRRQLPSTTP